MIANHSDYVVEELCNFNQSYGFGSKLTGSISDPRERKNGEKKTLSRSK